MAEQWTHEQLRDYLKSEEGRGRSEGRGAWGVEREAKGEERGAKSEEHGTKSVMRGALALLLDLLEEIKDGVEISEAVKDKENPRSFDETEEMLSALMSGAGSGEMKHRFLGALYHSADFYQRVLVKMEHLVPAMAEAIPAEMAQVAIKTDDQILNEIGIAKQGELEPKLTNPFRIKFQEIAERLFGWLVPSPRYAYVMAVLILGLIIVIPGSVLYYVSLEDDREDIFTEYMYDDKVPYEYDRSGLRGESEIVNTDKLIAVFNNQFKLGISHYVLLDYSGAINTFNNMTQMAIEIENGENVEIYTPILRDYYFYYGVSLFAMSKHASANEAMINIYLTKSIDLLSHAKLLASKLRMEGIDKETFFLGIVYGFNGQLELAIQELRKIDIHSIYFKKSLKLIDVWSHSLRNPR